MLTLIRRLRLDVALLISLLVLPALFALPQRAWAHASGCRTDPVVSLSNGATVTLWSDISTSLDQVRAVRYELHVPNHVSVTGIAFPDGLDYLESVVVYSDQAVSSYSSATVVQTATSNIPVSVYMETTLASRTSKSKTVYGRSYQTLQALLVVVH
jgi:hypothetical protein